MWWYYRGIVLLNSGQSSDAGNSFDKVIAIKPDFAEAWYYRGVVLYNLGQYSEALTSMDRAIAIKPDYVDAKQRRKSLLNIINKTKN